MRAERQMRAREDRLLGVGNAGLPQLLDLVADGFAFGGKRRRRGHGDRAAGAACRRPARRHAATAHGAGEPREGLHDRRMGAVVVGERMALAAEGRSRRSQRSTAARPETGKWTGADRQPPTRRRPSCVSARRSSRAREIHVLKLIDKDMLEPGDIGLDLGMVFDEFGRHHNQIAEIDGIRFLQLLFIDAVDRGDFERTVGIFMLFLGRAPPP